MTQEQLKLPGKFFNSNKTNSCVNSRSNSRRYVTRTDVTNSKYNGGNNAFKLVRTRLSCGGSQPSGMAETEYEPLVTK